MLLISLSASMMSQETYQIHTQLNLCNFCRIDLKKQSNALEIG